MNYTGAKITTTTTKLKKEEKKKVKDEKGIEGRRQEKRKKRKKKNNNKANKQKNKNLQELFNNGKQYIYMELNSEEEEKIFEKIMAQMSQIYLYIKLYHNI